MSEPVQVVPFLTACVDEGEFTLRVDDSALAKAVAPLLLKAIGEAEGARKLTLVTPSDLKVYKFNGRGVAPPASAEGKKGTPALAEPASPPPDVPATRVSISQDLGAPPAPEIADYERQMAEAAKMARLMAQQNSEVVEFPQGDAKLAPKKPPVGKKEAASPPSACGRCRGAGMLEGGGACPVCQGRGVITRFGRQRR
jgi:hypothetical protein